MHGHSNINFIYKTVVSLVGIKQIIRLSNKNLGDLKEMRF